MSDHNNLIASAPSPRRLRLIGVIATVIVVAVVILGIATRISDARQLKTWTDAQSVPTVNVISPESSAAGAPLELPARIEAYARAPIYARIDGYLKSWNVDIGTKVKAGQVLAQIETPDLDQQLLQAKADYASAQANEALASTTAKRWQSMLQSDSVSKQEVDEKTGDFTAKQALANAARANVERINAMKNYTRIVAPFDGVVTARNTDVGALINAGSGGNGQALFEVSNVSKLRVYVQVPQSYVPQIATGAVATLSVPEHPGQKFSAKVESSAQAVSAASGSTLVQLSVDNADGQLLPGSFANVRFDIAASKSALRVPASALVFDDNGTRLATIGSDDRVKFKTISILHDYGKSVEIASGISTDDRVIDSPPDGLADGDHVQVAASDASDNTPAKAHAKA